MSANGGTSDPMSNSVWYGCSNSYAGDDALCYRKLRDVRIDKSDAIRYLVEPIKGWFLVK